MRFGLVTQNATTEIKNLMENVRRQECLGEIISTFKLATNLVMMEMAISLSYIQSAYPDLHVYLSRS